MIAVDVSNYTGAFTDAQAKALRDAARRLVANTHDPAVAAAQVLAGQRACMEAQLYAQQYFDVPIARELDKADQIAAKVAAGGGSPIGWLWLAFEDAVPAGVSVDVVDGWIQRCVDQARARGWDVGIYTRKSWWAQATGDEPWWFAAGGGGLPLWDANPDGAADVAAGFQAYGGLAAPAMKQYADDVQVAGLNVDLSAY